MLGTSYIKVDIPPVAVSLLSDKGIPIMRVHIAQIIRAAACKAGHGALFYRPAVHIPVSGTSQRRLARRCRKILVNLRKPERKAIKRHRSSDSVLEIDRERLSPISLA